MIIPENVYVNKTTQTEKVIVRNIHEYMYSYMNVTAFNEKRGQEFGRK